MEDNARTILLVDDSSVNNLLLENILEEEGFEVKTAFNAKEAMGVLRKTHIDLVLLDIMMPRVSGFELLEQINGEFGLGKFPVVMVTALKEKEDRKKAEALGAVGYLTKPIDINQVLETVRGAIKE